MMRGCRCGLSPMLMLQLMLPQIGLAQVEKHIKTAYGVDNRVGESSASITWKNYAQATVALVSNSNLDCESSSTLCTLSSWVSVCPRLILADMRVTKSRRPAPERF